MRLAAARPTILMLAGFIGASGVVLAAAASHGGDGRLLGSASTMCLAHAPVLLALYLADGRMRTANAAALVLALGTLLFSADLLSRHFIQSALFPMAAPTGGMLMIIGWLLIAIGGLFREGRT
jgi:uncharacterized membrane protein YgdD (TMEM256/DUF423 family)